MLIRLVASLLSDENNILGLHKRKYTYLYLESSIVFFPFFIFNNLFPSGNAEQRIVCYYTNWSVYRPGTAKYSPQNINPYLCTHLIYAFGGFTKDNTLKPFDKYQDIEKGIQNSRNSRIIFFFFE